MERSPLAPDQFPELPLIEGITLTVAATGMKYKDRDDLFLMQCDEGTYLAGLFTTSATASVSVHASRAVARAGAVRAILVNAGNANAFTGARGDEAHHECVSSLAQILEIPETQIATASTGVIGEPLDSQAIITHFQSLRSAAPANWHAAAKAIKTTDTFAKGAGKTIMINGKPICISAIAKGSGMIAPDMATMLAFIATDASIAKAELQDMLRRQCAKSFNAITVDSDTSTSDSVFFCATGKAGVINQKDDLAAFEEALGEIMQDLAVQIVRDGEGASKLITIDVTGAVDDASAHRIAMAIGNSPLVKTAIAGEDANWGRIVAAVGKAGEPADRDKLAIAIGGIVITDAGQRRDDYDETPVTAHMKEDEISLHIDIGLGTGTARIWTCDLTHGYITINADYRS